MNLTNKDITVRWLTKEANPELDKIQETRLQLLGNSGYSFIMISSKEATWWKRRMSKEVGKFFTNKVITIRANQAISAFLRASSEVLTADL